MLAAKEEIRIEQAVVHIMDSSSGSSCIIRYPFRLWF